MLSGVNRENKTQHTQLQSKFVQRFDQNHQNNRPMGNIAHLRKKSNQ